MATKRNGKAETEEIVITPHIIVDTEGRNWQQAETKTTESPMPAVESIVPKEASTSQPSSQLSGELALYDPNLTDLQALLDAVEVAEEESELQVLVVDQNKLILDQEVEVLQTIQQKIQKIRQNKQKAQAGTAQVRAKQRLAEMLKKQIGSPDSI